MFQLDCGIHTKAVIDNMLKTGSIPHAIIIQGTSESASANTADYIAEGAVCLGQAKPCGVCLSCKKFKSGNHPDVIKISGGSGSRSFHKEVITDLIKDAYIIPNESDNKVYILSNTENMTAEAQNAFLKIMEEPPAFDIFILLCKDKSKLLPTVISRSIILTVDADRASNPEARKKAEDILTFLLNENELELLKLCYNCFSAKNLLNELNDEMLIILREAYICKLQGKTLNEVAKNLASRLTVKQIFSLINVIKETKSAVEANANATLLGAHICASLRQAAGL